MDTISPGIALLSDVILSVVTPTGSSDVNVHSSILCNRSRFFYRAITKNPSTSVVIESGAKKIGIKLEIKERLDIFISFLW
jgi:hypothetical protein